MRSFDTLSEREILALAVSLEEEDERVYADYAERLRAEFPASAAVLDGMRQEESTHRARLLDRYRRRFGDHVPLIRRQDVRGFVARRSPWFVRSLGPEVIRRQAEAAEVESRRFYETIAPHAGLRIGDDTPERVRFVAAGASFSLVPGAPTEHLHVAFPTHDDADVDRPDRDQSDADGGADHPPSVHRHDETAIAHRCAVLRPGTAARLMTR